MLLGTSWMLCCGTVWFNRITGCKPELSLRLNTVWEPVRKSHFCNKTRLQTVKPGGFTGDCWETKQNSSRVVCVWHSELLPYFWHSKTTHTHTNQYAWRITALTLQLSYLHLWPDNPRRSFSKHMHVQAHTRTLKRKTLTVAAAWILTIPIFLTLKPTSCTGVKGLHIYVYIFLTKLILTAKKNQMSPKHFISLQLRDSIRVYHCKYSNFTVS